MKAFGLVHRSPLACAALGAALLAGTALGSEAAGGRPAARTLTVRYADVNLATVAGATTLYRRIQGAARLVCGEPGRSLSEQREWAQCYRDAVNDAVATVNNPTLTAVHSGREAPIAALRGS